MKIYTLQRESQKRNNHLSRASHADSEVGLDPRALVEHACVNGLAHRSVHFVAKNPVGGSL